MIQQGQTTTPQPMTTGPASWGTAAPGSPEAAEERLADLQALIDTKERTLNTSKGRLEYYQKEEDSWKTTSDKELKKLNSLARQDTVLKRVGKVLRFTGVPSPFIMTFGVVLHNPIMAAVGMVLLAGSVAVKVYANRRLPEIDRQFYPLKDQCQASMNNYNAAKGLRERTEGEVEILEKECAMLRDKREKAVAEVRKMAESLASGDPSGASEVIDDDEYVRIDGFKIKKHEAEQG